jgi:hypothetical protein
MSTRGFESGLNLVPISTRNVEWTIRTTYQKNVQNMDKLAVPAFVAPGGSFGSGYGRNRIAVGARPSLIWGLTHWSCVNTTDASGNVVAGTGADGLPCHQVMPNDAAFAPGGQYAGKYVTRDSVIADANPRGQMSFLNALRWRRLTVTALLDWRNGGATANLTKNLFDEGGNSRDYDNGSALTGQTLGQYRYGSFTGGNIVPYIDDGTFVKLRELSISLDAPKRWADLARAATLRIEMQGRNLYMWSKYWSFDPEFNNFGNQNFNRFIDLAPYPSMRQFFLSVNLGY